MALQNLYHLRRVAPTAQKPCFICYKPTACVLITPDNRDHFYTCEGHLKDPGFASPSVSKEEEEERRRKQEMAEEVEKVKREYEEKVKRRKKEKGKEKGKGEEGKKEEKKDEEGKEEKERDDKIKALESASTSTSAPQPETPRIFTLHRNVYQMRLARLQNAQQAKRTAERMKNPVAFPAVPSGNP